MKAEKTCSHCGKDYKTTSRQSKFCSTACRVFAYRKRKNIPEPSYLRKHNSPKRQVVQEIDKRFRVPTPEFKELLDKEAAMMEKMATLQRRKYNAIRSLNKIIKKQNPDFFSKLEAPGLKKSEKNDQTLMSLSLIHKLAWKITEIEIWLEKVKRLKREIESWEYVTKKVEITVDIPVTESVGSPWESALDLKERAIPIIVNSYKTVTLRNVNNQKYKAINFIGKWAQIFGKPSTTFRCLIEDMDGNREFIGEFANYLAEEFGNLVYFSDRVEILESVVQTASELGCEYIYPALRSDFQQMKQSLASDKLEFVVIDHYEVDDENISEINPYLRRSALILISNAHGTISPDQFDIHIQIENGEVTCLHNCF